MKRTTIDGKKVNQRTADMINRAQDRLGENLIIVQGSYNAGGVAASGGTHDGGGAIDISVRNLKDPALVVRVLREVGFAAWFRPTISGLWTQHIHAIAIGDSDLSSGARSQVSDYYAGRNGLRGGAPDEGPRLNPIPTWPVKMSNVVSAIVIRQFKSKKPAKRVNVKRFQRGLACKLGRNLVIDGVAGPQTRNAFKDFQKGRRLPVTGVPTREEVKAVCAGFSRVL